MNPSRVSTPRGLLLVGSILAAVFLYGCPARDSNAKGPGFGKKGGDVPVTITKAAKRSVPIEIQVIGTAEAYATITVKSQVGGQLVKANFHEGDFVKAGDLLFNVDRRPLDAQMQQLQATLSKNEAQGKQAEANLARDTANAEYARVQASRAAQLTKQGIFAREQNDQAQAAAQAAEQAVAADKAAIESAQADMATTKANMNTLRVQLGYTEIRSPISGRTGTMLVKPGNIVTANTTDLITINQVEPIYVAFSVPEVQLNSIKNYMAKGALAVFANPQDSNEPPQQGKLSFIENAVDPTTGTIRLRGTFPNVGRKLWPGQFLRVTLRLATRDDAIVIANQAVQTGQDGSYVYVVKQDRAVESRPIVTGARVGQDLVVEKGLEDGETVVLEGQLRLSPGMKVIVGQRKGGGKKGGGGPRPEGAPAPEGGAPAAAPAPDAAPGNQPRPEGAPTGERPPRGEGRKGPRGPQ